MSAECGPHRAGATRAFTGAGEDGQAEAAATGTCPSTANEPTSYLTPERWGGNTQKGQGGPLPPLAPSPRPPGRPGAIRDRCRASGGGGLSTRGRRREKRSGYTVETVLLAPALRPTNLAAGVAVLLV